MAMQKKVNLYQAAAVQGDRASQNPTVYMPFNFLAGGSITVGTFVWQDPANPNEILNSGTGAPLGFIERILTNFNYVLTSEGTLIVEEGGELAVAVRGDFYALADASVTVGMAVFANNTTGAVKFAEAGSTQSGYTETNWRALTAGAAGDLIIISNWTSQGAAPDLSAYAKADLSNVTGQLPIANGGTGVTAVGTAGQVLSTNAAADGTEWATKA
jgi:hypothetical protein